MRLIDCYTPLISTALHPATLSTEAEPTEIHDQFVELAEQCRQLCEQHGYNTSQQEDALFAVVAWIDEQRLCTENLRSWWLASALQNTLFNTTSGGDEFYHRLARVQENDSQLREVYKHCLALGFRGNMYAEQNRFEEFFKTTFGCSAEDLEQDMPHPLFPRGYGGRQVSSRGLRRVRSITLTILVIVFSAGLLGGLYLLGQRSLELASSSLKTVGL